MRASVIIPAFNVEKYIIEALESVLNQRRVTITDLEVIVVDDGSTDKTAQVAQEYINQSNLNIKFKRQENQGAGSARNKAMGLATGDIYFMLDGDDFLHCDCIATCLNKFKTSLSTDLVYSDHANVNAKGNITELRLKQAFNPAKFLAKNYIGHVKAIRREVAIPFDENIHYAEDYQWLMQLMNNGVSFVHVPRVLYYWRRGHESVSSRISIEERDRNTRMIQERATIQSLPPPLPSS